RPPRSTLFPYTTLFRSSTHEGGQTQTKPDTAGRVWRGPQESTHEGGQGQTKPDTAGRVWRGAQESTHEGGQAQTKPDTAVPTWKEAQKSAHPNLQPRRFQLAKKSVTATAARTNAVNSIRCQRRQCACPYTRTEAAS